jgi:ribosomal protein S18 acetylase RimI-like enzyme
MVTIRNIMPIEAEKYQALRLKALSNSPEAFTASYEETLTQSIESIRERINISKDNFILGAFNDLEDIVGMVGFYRVQTKKLNHKGHIWGTYVLPEYRGQSIGYKLLEELLIRVRLVKGIRQVNLGVITVNENARKLYQSIGFQVYGFEKGAFRHNDTFYDEELMTYSLIGERT